MAHNGNLLSKSTTRDMAVDDEAYEGLIQNEDNSVPITLRYKRQWTNSLVVPWTLTSLFICTTLFFALRSNLSHSYGSDSYEHGYSTDFGISHVVIVYVIILLTGSGTSDPLIPVQIVKKHFTNDLLYNRTSATFYNQPLDPNETHYIGSSPSVEVAWHNLLHAQYIALTDGEAKQFPSGHIAPAWYDGERNFMELSVFHNLHCLNEIRLALNTHNHEDGMKIKRSAHAMLNGDVHLGHCVDQIRQALMCHADLTPVPMKPVEGNEDTLLGNGEMHTCRDFDAIWGWVEGRSRRWKAFGD